MAGGVDDTLRSTCENWIAYATLFRFIQFYLWRFAYYIAIHHNIEQFRWTFASIYNEEDVFAIHVDHKSGQRFYDAVCQVAAHKPNVHFIPRRTCSWSGWSCCLAELQGIRKLLTLDRHWQYLINLSGQCYPIKRIQRIRDTVSGAWPQNFIRVWSFAYIAETEPDDPHIKRPVVVELGGRIRRLPFHWADNPAVNWKGSTWHMLTRPFCEWTFESGVLNRLPPAMKYTFCPDEILFQTLIMHSPFRDTVKDDYGREIVWPAPKVLTIEDWPRLSTSSAFFARKFDCNKDEQILRLLAEANALTVPKTDVPAGS